MKGIKQFLFASSAVTAAVALECEEWPASPADCDFDFSALDGSCNHLSDRLMGAAMTPFEQADAAIRNVDDLVSARYISNTMSVPEVARTNRPLNSLAWVFGQFLDHDITLALEDETETISIPIPEGDPFAAELAESSGRRLLQRGGPPSGRAPPAGGPAAVGPAGGAPVIPPANGGGPGGRPRPPPQGDQGGRVTGGAVETVEGVVIPLHRSKVMCPFANRDNLAEGDREVTNFISSFIDASNVYSSNTTYAPELRAGAAGLLLFRPGPDGHDMLPLQDDGFAAAGDVRANEHAGLTILHTLWLREHNRIARELVPEYANGFGAAACVNACDEVVFQQARKAVRALMQKVVYEEFLPAVLGNNALSPYAGYSANVDSHISTEFSTSAYRFGHSMVNEQLLRLSAMDVNSPSPAGPLLLADAFFTPEHVEGPGSVDELVRGLIMQPAEAIDMEVADVLRNNLFGEQDDLLARNIQRGRDHHQMTYVQARRHYNLPTPRRFSDISGDNDIANRVADAHQFDINAVELFVGGLAEAPFGDSQLGELFTRILADQFERLRDGDRHFYQAFQFPNAPSLGKTQAEIRDERTVYNRFVRNTGFADVLLRNTNVEAGPWMEGNPFLL